MPIPSSSLRSRTLRYMCRGALERNQLSNVGTRSLSALSSHYAVPKHVTTTAKVSASTKLVAPHDTKLANFSSTASATTPGESKFATPFKPRPDLCKEVDMKELLRMAELRCTPLSLKDMYMYAVDFANVEQRLRNAQFLHRELPLRMAQRAADLLTLPHELSNVQHIQDIAGYYLNYLEQFKQRPSPSTQEEEDAFTDMLQSFIVDRKSIPKYVARGVDEWLTKTANTADSEQQREELREMEEALYRFFTARVGLRFLIEHHIFSSPTRNGLEARKTQSSLIEPEYRDQETYLGCIQKDCDPVREVARVANSVAFQMEEKYGCCPEIQVVQASQESPKATFTYVPHHLHHMVGELLKNSCTAIVKKAQSEHLGKLTPIRVVVVRGDEDVVIKVSDKAGGIPRSQMADVWKFARRMDTMADTSGDDGPTRRFGLPLARIYARYFGGELALKSMEGYGLDAYLHLPRLGDSGENLPLQVKFSPGELNSNPPRHNKNRMITRRI
eukprot:Nitzschia sp. Nitz4//scaffold77_size91520//61045//62638//NITZ4_004898-RA/size91520-augustus-gene-0.64-mRNA-1//1//CDS//3329558015//8999//frame0